MKCRNTMTKLMKNLQLSTAMTMMRKNSKKVISKKEDYISYKKRINLSIIGNILQQKYMEIIDKNFNRIYATKWDVEELINEERDMIPDKPCFEHYKDSLESLFREYKAQDEVHSSSEEEVEHDEAMESDDETDKSDHQPIIVTPTKSDFSDNASLEDI
ncbi:hypothetical protein L6452_25669 [Arctium lappa]|uniref:Uncharacterized protein n=1 Tax=Arctium lappa TaxID=4217 RepID=A0ACB9AD48_ARCLA|nr:hypothetical protein L6452_25669 [Arctium lappa]